MKIIVVAQILEGLYYNGVIRSSRKLDKRDFLQMSKAAKGSVIRKFYFDSKASDGLYAFIAANTKEKEYEVTKDERGRLIIKFDFDAEKIIKLPDGNGILRITPIDSTGKISYDRNFTKGIAGSEYLYCTDRFLEDTGEEIYINISDQIRLFTANKPEMVEMLAVLDDDDTEISEDIAWEILTYVATVILKVVGFPTDNTDDNNPTVKLINSKLASAQTA